jgi:hypothetical protein
VTSGGLFKCALEVGLAAVSDPETRVETSTDPWPRLDSTAFHGLAGEIVRAIEPETEADPAGVLLTMHSMFGNAVGSGPHAVADGSLHPARINLVLVGKTAKSR